MPQDNSTHQEMLDDMALPFLDLAEKLESCRLNGADTETWRAVLETNLFLWRFISHFLPRHFADDVPEGASELLNKISEFMIKVSVAIRDDPMADPDLIAKVVQLNLNMCDQILSIRVR